MTETVSGGAPQKAAGKAKAGAGMKIEQVFSTPGVHPYDEITWERRDVVQTMARSDDTILEGVHQRLELAGFPHRWLIRVQSGVVHLWGETDPKHQQEAVVVAESVPGVIRVTVSGPPRAGTSSSSPAAGGVAGPGIAATRR